MPYYEELVQTWFNARYVTMKTIDQLRLSGASGLVVPFLLVSMPVRS